MLIFVHKVSVDIYTNLKVVALSQFLFIHILKLSF